MASSSLKTSQKRSREEIADELPSAKAVPSHSEKELEVVSNKIRSLDDIEDLAERLAELFWVPEDYDDKYFLESALCPGYRLFVEDNISLSDDEILAKVKKGEAHKLLRAHLDLNPSLAEYWISLACPPNENFDIDDFGDTEADSWDAVRERFDRCIVLLEGHLLMSRDDAVMFLKKAFVDYSKYFELVDKKRCTALCVIISWFDTNHRDHFDLNEFIHRRPLKGYGYDNLIETVNADQAFKNRAADLFLFEKIVN